MTSQADAEFAIHKEAMAYIHIQRLDQHATELYKTFPGLYNWGQLWDMLQPDDARHGGVSQSTPSGHQSQSMSGYYKAGSGGINSMSGDDKFCRSIWVIATKFSQAA